MSNVNKEVAGVFEIILMHATTKHAQTIGMLEWSHAAIVQALNIQTGQRRSLCHKYVSIAVLNYNTSYHVSIGCEPSRFFHGRIPYEVPDLKMGFRLEKTPVHQVHQLLKTSSNRRKRFSKTLAKMPRKLISNTKRTMIRKITRQNLNEKIMSTFWSLKQTSLQNFVGLSLRILKRLYHTILIWYAEIGQTECKCFIACVYANSHHDNQCPMYKERHENGNPIREWALNMMIRTPEHKIANTTGWFLITVTVLWHPIHPNLQYDLIW